MSVSVDQRIERARRQKRNVGIRDDDRPRETSQFIAVHATHDGVAGAVLLLLMSQGDARRRRSFFLPGFNSLLNELLLMADDHDEVVGVQPLRGIQRMGE